MHFSKLYIQQNFVPDVVADQFGRKVIGVEVSLNEGESLDEAKETAQNYIKEYIEKNTVYHSSPIIPNGDRQPPELAVLPSIQVEKPLEEMTIIEQINSCKEFKVLESYYFVVKNNAALQNVYDIKKKQLQKIEEKQILDLTDAFYTAKKRTTHN
jgi:hypothetical protein